MGWEGVIGWEEGGNESRGLFVCCLFVCMLVYPIEIGDWGVGLLLWEGVRGSEEGGDEGGGCFLFFCLFLLVCPIGRLGIGVLASCCGRVLLRGWS